MCSLYQQFVNASINFALEPALCWRTKVESCTITYKQLAQESLKIENILNECAKDAEFIGICIQQHLSLPAIILGILQHGLSFACLEYEDSNNISYLIRRLNIRWIFCEKQLEKCIKDTGYCWVTYKTIKVNENELTLYKKIESDSKIQDSIEQTWNLKIGKMAYAIQTSGSTGLPKIVRVPHSCIVPNIEDIRNILQVGPGDLIFLTAPSTFDPSIVEMFLALTTGATLLIVPKYVKASPQLLLEALFRERGITVLEATPSFILRWSLEEIQNILLAKKSTLRALILGGEPCPPPHLLKCWKSKGNQTNIYNIYGITEVSCWATMQHVSLDGEEFVDEVPLGNALKGTLLQVRDEEGLEISNGEGELFIGGLERVCLIDDETLESASCPIYRATGDVVKIDSDSKNIFFLRRRNNTVKRYGSRVSFTKVEQIAIKHGAVEQACCVWEESTEKLCLVVKAEKSVGPNQNFLRKLRYYLHKYLEPASIPDDIICLQYLPLTKNGKINFQELKSFITKKILKQREELGSVKNTRNIFSELWAYYLNLAESPKPDDTFIHSGGNSVTALQLVTEFEQITHSAAPRLVGLLLQEATFEDCYKVLTAEIQSSSISIKNRATENVLFLDYRKRSGLVVQDVPTKQLKLESIDKNYNKEEINHSLNAEQHNTMQELNISVSCCRGKTEHFGDYTKSYTELHGSECITVKWKFKLGKCVDSSPRFIKHKRDGGIVIIGSHSHKLAILRSENGNLISVSDLNDRIESSACISLCGKYTFLGSYDGSIYCIKIDTGEIMWKYQTGDMIKSSPVLCSSIAAVVIGSYDHSLYCIQIQDGNLLWSVKIGNSGIYSSPCISASSSTVFVANLQGLCVAAAEQTGNVLWSNKLETPVFSSPAMIHNETAIIFAEVSGLVHCFKAGSGEKIWTFKAEGNIFSSFCTQDLETDDHRLEIIVFGSHDKHIYCIKSDFTDHKICLRWKCRLDSQIFATPILFTCSMQTEAQHLITLVATATTKGTVYIVDANLGTVNCSFSLPGEVFSSPAVFNNQIFIGCRDDYVYALTLS